jgi:hypothetical protein
MSINRNNYEEYFLLYVDNELPAAEKSMVEVFVTENPDLQEELLMLQQSVVKPDAVRFSGKQGLLKPLPVDAATEEKLLLLLDGELPAKEQKAVLDLTTTNKAVQEEWQLLQQAKLSAGEVIVFEDKASLYRKEHKRVISIRWWQMAAAAMLIGFGLWGTVSYLNRSETLSIETAASPANTNRVEKAKPVTEPVQETIAPVSSPQQVTDVAVSTTIKPDNKKDIKTSPVNADGKQVQLSPVNNNRDVAGNQDKKKLPTAPPVLENLNNSERNKTDFVNVTATKKEINTAPNDEGAQITTLPVNSFASNASFIENDVTDTGFASFDEEDNDSPKKTKLGGFFKKVKRVIERKTKIKTGSSDDVKIANMSFVMH